MDRPTSSNAAPSNADTSNGAVSRGIRQSADEVHRLVVAAIEKIRELFICPICYCYVSVAGVGKECPGEHRVCVKCADHPSLMARYEDDDVIDLEPYPRCPLCRGRLGTPKRNNFFKQVADVLLFDCRTDLGGCGYQASSYELGHDHALLCPSRQLACPISHCSVHSANGVLRTFDFDHFVPAIRNDHDTIWILEQTNAVELFCELAVERNVSTPRTSLTWVVGIVTPENGHYIIENELERTNHAWTAKMVGLDNEATYDRVRILIGKDNGREFERKVEIAKANDKNEIGVECKHAVIMNGVTGGLSFFQNLATRDGDKWVVRVKLEMIRRECSNMPLYHAVATKKKLEPFTKNKRMVRMDTGRQRTNSIARSGSGGSVAATVNGNEAGGYGEPPNRRARLVGYDDPTDEDDDDVTTMSILDMLPSPFSTTHSR
jgi:hypothetical protein